MKLNSENERIKDRYFQYRKEADGTDEATIDADAKAIARFETANRFRDFRLFHREWAIA